MSLLGMLRTTCTIQRRDVQKGTAGGQTMAWGDVVTACVVAGPETEAALRKACETLEPAARPRRYAFVPVMPTNASGKTDRAAIAKLTA